MSTQIQKKRKQEETNGTAEHDDRDAIIRRLQAEVAELRDRQSPYFASACAVIPRLTHHEIPDHGMAARHVKERIVQQNQLDNKPRLNTSSYVNVVLEPEEEEVALLGLATNLADGSVYPSSVRLHDSCVNMIAKLWNAPPPVGDPKGNYSGAGTVGSTEACLLAGLALKFRWRNWYAKKHGMTDAQVLGVMPNMIISSCFQAAWEKFFRYFDVEARFCKPHIKDKLKVDPKKLVGMCDDKTIAVVGILGNHYNGAYDPIWEIDEELSKLNAEKGYQIGIHVDAASGGFIAPFQDGMPPFDFRLKNVMTISASGHKFGESVCGSGWIVFRERKDLAEHIAISVTYLGGKSDSMTLNFSRPATAAYVQYYKFLRMGKSGYKKKVDQQMMTAKYLRDKLKNMKHLDGAPRFEMIDDGDTHCLPVVGARLHSDRQLEYDDIDLQHALAESHWYVSGYSLSFEDFTKGGELDSLLNAECISSTMFRIVVKSNLTMSLAEDLADHIEAVMPVMDAMKDGYHSVKSDGIKQDHTQKVEQAIKRGSLTDRASFRKKRYQNKAHAAC